MADAVAVCDAEFREKDGTTDLKVSVYQLGGPADVVQACAEHAASIPLDPKATANVDFEGLTSPPVNAPGPGRFAFTRTAHRNIVFESREALVTAVASLLADLGDRLHRVNRDQLRDYVRARRDAADPEWTAFLAACPAKWQKLVE